MIKDVFLEDVKDFVIEIENDNGKNRVIFCHNKNGNLNKSFRIITWHNHLCISGDMGDFVYSRTDDMFEFFRKDKLEINTSYWTEKMTSCSVFGGGDEGRGNKFNPDKTKKNVLKYIEDDEDWTDEDKKELKDRVDDFCFGNNLDIIYPDILELFDEYGEYDYESIRDFFVVEETYHTKWCLYAIVWAIQQYDSINKV